MSSTPQDRLLEHQFGPRPHRHRRAIPARGSARHPVPAGNQGDRRATFPTALFRRLGYDHHDHLRPARCTTASRSSAACRCARTTGSTGRPMARRAMSACGCESGMRLENVYVPAGGDIPDREVNPKFGQKLDFLERMTRWSESCDVPDDPGRRLQHRAARMRRLEPQAAAQRRQPHADRGRGARPAAGEQRLGRSRPPFPSRRPQRLHTWWSYRSPDWTENDRGRRLDHMWATPDVAAQGGRRTRCIEPCRNWRSRPTMCRS